MAKTRSFWSWHSEWLEVASIQNSPWSQENSKQAICAEVLPSTAMYNLPQQAQTQTSASQVGTHSRAQRLNPNQAWTALSQEEAPEKVKQQPEIFVMPFICSVKQHVPTCGTKLGAQLWHEHDLSQQKAARHRSAVMDLSARPIRERQWQPNVEYQWWLVKAPTKQSLHNKWRIKVCRWDGKWWHANSGTDQLVLLLQRGHADRKAS